MLVELWLAITWFMYSYNPNNGTATPMGELRFAWFHCTSQVLSCHLFWHRMVSDCCCCFVTVCYPSSLSVGVFSHSWDMTFSSLEDKYIWWSKTSLKRKTKIGEKWHHEMSRNSSKQIRHDKRRAVYLSCCNLLFVRRKHNSISLVIFVFVICCSYKMSRKS